MLYSAVTRKITALTAVMARTKLYTSDATIAGRSSGSTTRRIVVAERTVRMATRHEVVAADGTSVQVRAGSVCVHGDSEGAVAMASAVRRGLEAAGVRVAPFVGTGSP